MVRVSAEDNEKLRGFHLARCRVERGCEDDEVLRLLRSHGVSWLEAKSFLAELKKKRDLRFRLKGLISLLIGLVILGGFAYLMSHQELLVSDVPGRKRGAGIFEAFLFGSILFGLGLTRIVLGGRGERSRGDW